ncbi:MAG: hypothetical protein RJA98_3968 [Pseudomonadota bacterium]|jgi:hypothetical protein
MFSALFSFFGGTAFRWLFGEILSFVKERDADKREIERMRLQFEQDAQRQQWQQAAIKAAADAGLQLVEAKAEAARQEWGDRAFLAAAESTGKPSGIKWIDGFNALIRPELAQVSILLIVGNALFPQHVVLQGVVLEVVCGALGLFLGGRISSTGR